MNFTTGTIGNKGAFGGGDLGPTGGPIACMEAGMPEIAALNSGSLNYLKSTSKNTWAWEPLMFENPVSKIQIMIEAMDRLNIKAECECFDTGIVRSIKMFEQVNMLKQPINVSLVMGVASGMPCKPEWVPLLKEELNEETQWQVIAIGRDDSTWPTLRKAAELGGHVRTGKVVVDLLPFFALNLFALYLYAYCFFLGVFRTGRHFLFTKWATRRDQRSVDRIIG